MAKLDSLIQLTEQIVSGVVQINSSDNAAVSRSLDRDMEMRKLMQSQDFQSQEALKNKEFQKKLRNQQLEMEHGPENLELNQDGFVTLKDDYDDSKSPSMQSKLNDQVNAQLIAKGLSVDGTSHDRRKRLKVYTHAELAGQSSKGVTLDPSISSYFPDLSPDSFTSHDVSDMKQFIDAVGYEDPRVLQSLVTAGVVAENDLHINPNNGLLSIHKFEEDASGNQVKTLDQFLLTNLDVAWKGFNKGVAFNEDYMTSQEYKDMLNQEVSTNLLMAEQITKHPVAVRASTKLAELKGSIGNYVGSATTDDGELVMKFKGVLTTKEAIHEHILGISGLTGPEQSQLMELYDGIFNIGLDGTGTGLVMEILKQDPKQILTLNKVDGTMGKLFSNAIVEDLAIDEVAGLASSYYGKPYSMQDMRKLDGVEDLLEYSGIRGDVLSLRNLELNMLADPNNAGTVQAYDNAKAALVEKIMDSKTKLEDEGRHSTPDKYGNYTWHDSELEDLYNKLDEWLVLEDTTFKLTQAKGRRRQVSGVQ